MSLQLLARQKSSDVLFIKYSDMAFALKFVWKEVNRRLTPPPPKKKKKKKKTPAAWTRTTNKCMVQQSEATSLTVVLPQPRYQGLSFSHPPETLQCFVSPKEYTFLSSRRIFLMVCSYLLYISGILLRYYLLYYQINCKYLNFDTHLVSTLNHCFFYLFVSQIQLTPNALFYLRNVGSN